MLKPITVLITGAGAPGAPGIIHCLRNNGERRLRLVGVDMNESASARRLVDAFYLVPSAKCPDFVQKVETICELENVQVILPLVTRELMLFSENSSRFSEKGISVSVMMPETLKIVNNKANLLTAMQERGLKVPGFFVFRSAADLPKVAKLLGYPDKAICVKSAEGNGSRGVRIIDAHKSKFDLLFQEKPNSMYMSMHDLQEALLEHDIIPEMIAMEYLPGEEYGVDALCERGKILYLSGRVNAVVNSSIPQTSIIEEKSEPIQQAIQIIEQLDLDGNVNFDFKYNEKGEARLLEINPRLSATIVSYAPAGINFPYLRVKQLLGERMPRLTIRQGIKMQRRYQEVFFDEKDREIKW